MKIFLGTDHAGFYLKEKIKQWLEEWGYSYEDLGAFMYDEQDDYPRFIRPVAEKVARDPENYRGIVLGGSGQGEAIVCNRMKGVRAAVYYGGNSKIVALSREHNNANILSLGARFVEEKEAKEAIKLWLDTACSTEERHQRRVAQIDE